MLGEWPVLEPFLDADTLINVPIAKHHSLTGVTLGMKNWYGLLGGDCNRLHQRIHESLVDLTAFAKPTLTIMDGYRVLMRNGPTGGNVEDVEAKGTVMASTDPVALDACAAKAWWDLDVPRLRYLRMAEERGIGRAAFESLRTTVSDSNPGVGSNYVSLPRPANGFVRDLADRQKRHRRTAPCIIIRRPRGIAPGSYASP